MSCEAIVAAAVLWLAPVSAADAAPQPRLFLADAPAVSALSHEPLFADIIGRAERLNGQILAWKGKPIPAADLASFKGDIVTLADLDMQAHRELARRGTDGDLKCILRGISEDLPVKFKAVEDAAPGPLRDAALTDLGYLLRDNIEVITTPAVVTSGT